MLYDRQRGWENNLTRLQPNRPQFQWEQSLSLHGDNIGLQANALAVKHAVKSGSTGPVLTFDDQTGRVVDIDTRGSEADLLDRPPHATLIPN